MQFPGIHTALPALAVILASSSPAGGQQLFIFDTLTAGLLQDTGGAGFQARVRLIHTLTWSAACQFLHLVNPAPGQGDGHLTLSHQVKYRSSLSCASWLVAGADLDHELGIRYLLDSTFQANPDETRFDARLATTTGKGIQFNIQSTLATRLLPAYSRFTGPSGAPSVRLSSSFLTPLTWSFSAGVQSPIPFFGSLSLGLPAGRLTWMARDRVYEEQQSDLVNGVERGRKLRIDYGLSLQVLIDRKVGGSMRWTLDLRLFRAHPGLYGLDVRNAVTLRITSFLRATLQSRLGYDDTAGHTLRGENHASLVLSFDF